MKKYKKPIATDMYMRNLIYSLLSNCVDEYSRLGDLKEEFQPESFPADMPEARQFFSALQIADEKNVQPTIENVTSILKIDLNVNEAVAAKWIEAIMPFQTADGAVADLSKMVGMDVTRREIETAAEAGMDILQNGEGRLSERLNTVVTKLAELQQKNGDDSYEIDQNELVDEHIVTLRKRKQNRDAGVATGPSLRFKGFVGERDEATGLWKTGKEGKIPVLRWGSTTLVTALPGRGKTTLAGVLAEHNAHHLGIDVLYIHNEVTQEEMMDRAISRNTTVPTDYLVNRFDYDDVNDIAHQKVTEYLAKLKRTKAQIRYIYCPDWNVYQINAAVSIARRLSNRNGRGLLVIVDYYNLINTSSFSTERAETLGKVAIQLREGVKRENLKSKLAGGVGVHMIVFAQETEHKESGETHAFGSKEIEQYCQVHISIKRDLAPMDSFMGKAKDAVGNQRYWSRAGQYSHETVLKILKANHDSMGEVAVWVENNLCAIYDPTPAAPAPEQKVKV